MAENIKQEEDVLAKDKKEKTPEQSNREVATIMPTMIDEYEDLQKVRDLSSIIPKQNEVVEIKENDISLISKENDLKSDGAITIANIDEQGEAIVKANFEYPEQIDYIARKEEFERNKNKKRKKAKVKPNKSAQKFQNGMSLFLLLLMIGLGIFFYIYKTSPTEKDFKPLHVKIELGDKLPLRTSSYVEAGRGEVDELLYVLDTSKVTLEEAGDYEFTVTYKGITKTGIITIKDTTAPLLEIKEVSIVEGGTYNAGSFVESCIDWSGCNYSFQDVNTDKKYTSPGTYKVHVVATDAYQNSVTKQTTLIIEAIGSVKTYVKDSGFLYDAGYSVTEKYELHYDDNGGYSIILSGKYTQVFTYQDELKYQEARKTYNGEIGYTCNDGDYSITYKKSVNTIGNNYSQKTDIESYLAREGYKEVG